MNAFNLLQDMRHLLIIDLRPAEAFKLGHIRKSLNVEMATISKVIMSAMLKPDTQFASKYEGDDLKRVLFIFPDDYSTSLEKVIS
jgi:hypothetical protein